MVLFQIQDNVIRAKHSLSKLENSVIYRSYRSFGGYGNFEMELRKLLNSSIDLRNSTIANIEAILRKSENKELIALIDSGYFTKITEAASTDSLIKIVKFGSSSISIPDTAAKVVFENKEIDTIIREIVADVSNYNKSIVEFLHQKNKVSITLYPLPSIKELPVPVEAAINFRSLLELTERDILPPPPKIEVVEKVKPIEIKEEIIIPIEEKTSGLKIRMKGFPK